MNLKILITYFACIIFLFLLGKFFILPLKFIAKILLNSILGGLIILIVNFVGSFFSFHIGLNIGTSIITGFLGVPRYNFTN